MIKKPVIYTLLNDSNISGMIGSRAWASQREDDTLPAVVVSLISGETETAQDGNHAPRQYRIQLLCYASTPGAVAQLADYIHTAFNGLSGSINGTDIDACFVVYESDLEGDLIPGKKEKVRVKQIDLEIHS